MAASATNGTVYYSNSLWKFVPGVLDHKGVAWASYNDWVNTKSAFRSLTVNTNSAFDDATQMYGAGFVEAALTQPRIKEHWDNMYAWLASNFPNGNIPEVYQQFFTAQDTWAREQAATNASAYWQVFSLLLQQFDGLRAGYAAVAPSSDQLTEYNFQALNAMGDFLDLIPALEPSASYNFDWWNKTPHEVMDRVRKTTHCSGLVKVNGDFSDLWFGHSSWFIYQGTLRIFKHYKLAMKNAAVAGQSMSFSSYPGVLSSLDDFYTVWSSGLAVIETTNSIFNTSLYSLVQPESLWAWQRVRMANLLSASGSAWSDNFAEYNSGTYNNQYDVIDVKLFSPGKALPSNLLWVVEQIPGLVVGGDVTQQLERGYFPSYNVPYWPAIYEASGYPAMIAKLADSAAPDGLGEIAGISYQLAPRAKIFRRDQGTVVDMQSFLAMMRYNDYTHDPYAAGSPWNAICSRGDLADPASPNGCYDTKASQATWWNTTTSFALNGPTLGVNNEYAPFAWTQFPTTSHEGLPTTYNYSFELQTPATL